MADAVQLRAGGATDVGAVRERNEDSLAVLPGLYVVADGMGGHAAGDVASRIAIDVMAGLCGRGDLSAADVAGAVRQANSAIVRAGTERPDRAGMGTTLTGVVVVRHVGDPGDASDGGDAIAPVGHAAAVLNVGDSRVYRFADGRLTQLTTDHNEVAELLAAGRLSEREAARHPLRNVVTRSLGTDEAVEPDVTVVPLVPGERFLACSDGLPLELGDAEIAAVLASTPDPQDAAERLVEAAVAAGGHDNVTAVVLDVLG